MNTIIVVTLSICLLAAGCAGSGGRKLVKPDPEQIIQETNTSIETMKSNGQSFAYRVSIAGGVLKRLLKDIPREQYLREVELRHVTDKQYRHSVKVTKPASTSILQLAGAAGSLALTPGIGDAATASNIAKITGSVALSGLAGRSSRQLSNWEKSMVLSWVIPWMPENEAKTPDEAALKMRQVLDQAMRDVAIGDSAIVDIPLPVLDDPPAIVIDSLQHTGKIWTWAKGKGIHVTASKLEPKTYKVYAAYDDVSNWKKISERLPRWCFVYLGTLASNGQYFVGYPQVLWNGKPYYFGE